MATSKNDGNEKFLLLRKKYLNECPSDDSIGNISTPLSPSGSNYSLTPDIESSPMRPPPPYRAPPEVSPAPVKLPIPESETRFQYKDCVDEFKHALSSISTKNSSEVKLSESESVIVDAPMVPPRKRNSVDKPISGDVSVEIVEEVPLDVSNKENISLVIEEGEANDKISVKEAMRKFNRIASVEEPKVPSPIGKKRPDKVGFFLFFFMLIYS